MIATDMTSSGDPEEKLRWAFRMYDKDGSGEIDVDEMVDIFSLMYTVQVASDVCKLVVDKVFISYVGKLLHNASDSSKKLSYISR